jgi:hypothetical protein
MRIKTLSFFRSRPNLSEEMAAEALPIPDPRTVWMPSMMTEAKIQLLVDRRLLRLKEEVECKAAVGEEFPTEDVKEQVVFASFFEPAFNLPVTSSGVFSTTTSRSWYILFPTPSP